MLTNIKVENNNLLISTKDIINSIENNNLAKIINDSKRFDIVKLLMLKFLEKGYSLGSIIDEVIKHDERVIIPSLIKRLNVYEETVNRFISGIDYNNIKMFFAVKEKGLINMQKYLFLKEHINDIKLEDLENLVK